jgi:hypothetical protein
LEKHSPDLEARKKISNALKTLYENRQNLFDNPAELREEYDLPDSPPIFNEDMIRFNGHKEYGNETFLIDWNNLTNFDFCKTAKKPYDFWVASTLLMIASELPDSFTISSDGNENEWEPIKNTLVEALEKSNIKFENLSKDIEVSFSELSNLQLKDNQHKENEEPTSGFMSFF